jgi:adenylosuccinate lyase
VAGMARLLRGNALAALENVALWHERDITHSSVERVIIPDSTIALDYMLAKFIEVVKNLTVYPEKMQANLEKTLGLIFSQRVMLTLVGKGIARETAYAWVQRNALESWRTREMFKDLVMKDGEIMKLLQPEEVEALFDYSYHTKNIDYILRRAGVLD